MSMGFQNNEVIKAGKPYLIKEEKEKKIKKNLKKKNIKNKTEKK